MIPVYATAGAIFYVSILMMYTLKEVNWDDLTEAAPVVVLLLLTPLTFSIAHGITLGFITYAAAKVLGGKLSSAARPQVRHCRYGRILLETFPSPQKTEYHQ